ncbi:MAG: type II toxin-antitoxin system prevent-host-death family antitoxin [Coriobacteriales bacterium]|jgi:prevent-host-death family protein|nr:type II toxin-antitoxin system prevent-host-death family antitoxin [Coriobacteriales bacterium]
MKQVNMHEAKTHLSSLVDEATKGQPFIIAKAGKPQVIVYAYQVFHEPQKRTGFMPDIVIPEDFDSILAAEIASLFNN